jgi:hypothetical protein
MKFLKRERAKILNFLLYFNSWLTHKNPFLELGGGGGDKFSIANNFLLKYLEKKSMMLNLTKLF